MRQWIKKLFAIRPSDRSRRGTLPAVVQLEDRVTPTTFQVLGFDDPTPLAPPTTFGDTQTVQSLRQAIIDSNANPGTGTDTVQLDSGTYRLTIQNSVNTQENQALKGDLDITSTIHTLIIQGKGTVNPGPTIIDAGALMDRIFQIVQPGTVVILKDLILRGGLARDDGTGGATPGGTHAHGGGILNLGGSLSLINVSVQGNKAQGSAQRDGKGGGIYSSDGTVTLSQSTLAANLALGSRGKTALTPTDGGPGGIGAGGGLYFVTGTVSLSDCEIYSNTAQGGEGGPGPNDLGGLLRFLGGNGGNGTGGGIHGEAGSLIVSGSSISANLARGGEGGPGSSDVEPGPAGGAGGNGIGGGLHVQTCSLTLTATTLSLNTAQGGTGGKGGSGFDGGTEKGNGGMGGSGTGGAFHADTATVSLSGCNVLSNTAAGGDGGEAGKGFNSGVGGTGGTGSGGGIAVDAGTLTLSNLVLHRNTALGGDGGQGSLDAVAGKGGSGLGGGLFSGTATISLSNSTLSSNTAQGGNGSDNLGQGGEVPGDGGDGQGGGMYLGGGIVTLGDNTLSFNLAQGGRGGEPRELNSRGFPVNGGNGGQAYGGALYVGAGDITLTGLTFTSDSARGGEGARGSGNTLPTWAERGGKGGNGGTGGEGKGGGVYIAAGNLAVSATRFVEERAIGGAGGHGGNADTPSGTLNSMPAIGGNGGGGGRGAGAGMFVAGGTVTLTTTTFLAGLALSLPGGQAGTGLDGNGAVGAGIGGQGGAIATSAQFDSLNIRFSRLVDNRAVNANGSNGAGGTIFIFNSDAAQAEDNWWGDNRGPETDRSGATAFGMTVNRWLQLNVVASPPSISPGESAILTADILTLNTGDRVDASNLVGLAPFPDPSGIIFSDAVNGTLSAAAVQLVNGQASAIFTGSTVGIAGVSVTADRALITAAINIKAASSVQVISLASPAVFGQPVTFTAIISSSIPGVTPTGTVQFVVDGADFGAPVPLDGIGHATSTAIGFLTGNTHTVTVVYSGNDDLAAGDGVVTQLVQTVAVEPDPTNPGRDALFVSSPASASDDQVKVKPIGSRSTGSTGVKLIATLDGVLTQSKYHQSFRALYVYLQGGNDIVRLTSSLTFDTHVTAGDGNNALILGKGNSTVVVGDGNNVIVAGNGNNTLQVGDGSNLIVAGRGSHTVQAGNGGNILIDGILTLKKPGDTLREVLDDWITGGATPTNVASLRSRLAVTFNRKNANQLLSGSGLDWFWWTYAGTSTNQEASDLRN